MSHEPTPACKERGRARQGSGRADRDMTPSCKLRSDIERYFFIFQGIADAH